MSIQDFVSKIVEAVQTSNLQIVGPIVIIAITAILRSKVSTAIPAFARGHVAFGIAVLLGALSPVADAILNGQVLGGVAGITKMLLDGAQIGLVGAGAFSGVKAITTRNDSKGKK